MDLATKYRGDDFNKMIGNDLNIELLQSFLGKKKPPQTYLFYGEHGLGKTTFARIMAKKLDCEIVEINNSNNRGIDTIRNDIYEGAQFTGFYHKAKAFILDEVHQLPALSQDALLKILEEPNENIFFFLCTTDPQKLKKTIVSRCQQIEVEKINTRQLYPYMIEISKKEGNEISKKVARQIAESSKGHVRDALKILQNVLQVKSEEKQLKLALQKIEEEGQIIDLCRILISDSGSWKQCKPILKALQNENPESIKKIIINYMQKTLLSDTGKDEIPAQIIDSLRGYYTDFAILCADIFSIFL